MRGRSGAPFLTRSVLRVPTRGPRGCWQAPAEDEKSIRQKLALLTRKLISEDDEMELLNIYRETQRLRAALDNIQPANPPAAKTASNLQRSTRSRKSSRRPGHPGSNLTKKRESAHSAQGMLSRCLYLPQAGSSLGGGQWSQPAHAVCGVFAAASQPRVAAAQRRPPPPLV